MTEEEIRTNRVKAVEVLRTTDERQGHGALYDQYSNCYCAAGVIARTLGHDPKDYRSQHGDDRAESYGWLEVALGLEESTIDTIWRMNDRERLSFKAIGDKLAERWGVK